MKKNLQRFGASVLAAAMVAQSVALPAAAETTKIDPSVAQSVAASAASAASAVQSLPKFTSTADLIKQTAQTLAAQGEVHELEQDDAKLEATAQSKAGMSLAALENALADAMYANAAAGKINTEAYGLNKDEMASVMAAHRRYWLYVRGRCALHDDPRRIPALWRRRPDGAAAGEHRGRCRHQGHQGRVLCYRAG